MTQEPVDGWSPDARREAGRVLAAALRTTSDRADALACSLAPDAPRSRDHYAVYEGHLVGPRQSVPYRATFPELAAFLGVLEAGDPGALELAVAMATELAPEVVIDAARILLPHRPWRGLGSGLGDALGRIPTEASFQLLLDHPGVPYFRDGLRHHDFAGGVARAWDVVAAAGDLARVDLDPRLRVDTLPVLAYLLRHDRERAYAEIVRLAREGSDTATWATHQLFSIGTPDSLGVLVSILDASPPGAPLRFPALYAVRVLLLEAPERAVDRLGGMDVLTSPGGAARLDALFSWLRADLWNDRPSRRWLSADPRFAELARWLVLYGAREKAALARDMLKTLPGAVVPRKKKPKAEAPTQLALPAEPAKEIDALHADLVALVARLRKVRYRFAQPRRVLVKPTAADLRALAKLEKTTRVPPVLSALWRTFGSVDLRGTDPSWPVAAYLGFPGASEPVWETDPLVFAPAAFVIGQALDESDEPPFLLRIAPDATGKAGYSGGLLTIALPTDTIDPRIEETGETLLGHVRRAIAWAGMPGLERIADRPEAWLAKVRS